MSDVERRTPGLPFAQIFAIKNLLCALCTVVNCICTGLERWQEHEGQGNDDGGEECAHEELQWADAPVFKVRLQN